MEARLIQPNGAAFFHQFVGIVEAAVGRQRNVALHRKHYLNLDATLCRVFQGLLYLMVKREVGIYDFNAVFGVANGIGVKLPDNLVRRVRLAVYYPYHLMPCAWAGVGFKTREVAVVARGAKIFIAMNVLLGHLPPHFHEDPLQGVNL